MRVRSISFRAFSARRHLLADVSEANARTVRSIARLPRSPVEHLASGKTAPTNPLRQIRATARARGESSSRATSAHTTKRERRRRQRAVYSSTSYRRFPSPLLRTAEAEMNRNARSGRSAIPRISGDWSTYRGAMIFVFHTVLADIAIRADRHIKTRAVATGDDILGPMMIDRSGRQVGDFCTRRGNPRCAVLVGETHARIGVGNVEIAADQRHAEGGIEPARKTDRVSATSTSPFGSV